MSPARPATAAPRRQSRSRPRPAGAGARGARRTRTRAPLRIRWDRVGRFTLLIVLVVVAALYVQQALAYFSVRSQADQQRATVVQLEHQNARLSREQKSLGNPMTIQRDARELGMVRPGERPYVITGLAATGH